MSSAYFSVVQRIYRDERIFFFMTEWLRNFDERTKKKIHCNSQSEPMKNTRRNLHSGNFSLFFFIAFGFRISSYGKHANKHRMKMLMSLCCCCSVCSVRSTYWVALLLCAVVFVFFFRWPLFSRSFEDNKKSCLSHWWNTVQITAFVHNYKRRLY